MSEAKSQLSALIAASDDTDVLIADDEQAAVLVSARRYDASLEQVEDLQDRLSVHERTGQTVSVDRAAARLDIDLT